MHREFIVFVCLISLTARLEADELLVHRFEQQQLTDEYFSEGATIGDLNRDGHPDVVHGPYWWEGPEFTRRHEIYPPKPQKRRGYSDNFFSWVDDFNGDGWNDILTVGFPGTPSFIYENPGNVTLDRHWIKHKIFDQIGNESPQFKNLVGDERLELIFARDGVFGYLSFDTKHSFVQQTFHAISEKITDTPFGHGLGVGDVDGDGRLDVLFKDGWLRQPESLVGDPLWTHNKYQFTEAGGADMFAYDVD